MDADEDSGTGTAFSMPETKVRAPVSGHGAAAPRVRP